MFGVSHYIQHFQTTGFSPGVDDDKWFVHNGDFSQITERDFTQRYFVSISNNKFDVWGFVPTIVLGYTHRDSNIWQREFDKFSAEFTMRQKF